MVAFALFAIGCPSGSLDVDGDGTPEVPLAVLGSSKDLTLLQAVVKQHRPTSGVVVEWLLSDVASNGFERIQAAELTFHQLRSAPSSFALLRC